MAEALYRKYRPQVFGDVVGQEHIERTIKNAVANDKISHAYLFTGPRGTGKTTTARLLAKALLCTRGPTPDPDGTCEDCHMIADGVHPDVYELDAASRTGVENVREEIIGRVQFAPTRGTYKVYIIDEVHMLSTAAFNALLKTLEEPPSHVVFILATTDPQKVPETIQSRCQRFDFRRIGLDGIVTRLGAVCASEGVEFEGAALELVAHRAEGGLRNALTALEQLIAFSEGKVTLQAAENMLGSMDSSDMAAIVRHVGERDVAACFKWTAEYVETGADLAQFTRDFAEHVRNLYVLSLAGNDVALEVSESERSQMVEELSLFGPDRLARLLAVLGDLSADLRTSINPRLSFEIALTRMVRPDSDLTLASLAERIEALEAGRCATAGAQGAAGRGRPAAPAEPSFDARAEESDMPVVERSAPRRMGSDGAVAAASRAEEKVGQAPAMGGLGARQAADAARPAAERGMAQEAAASPSSQQNGADAQVSGKLSASLEDPSSLQRMWQHVIALLKKEKAAYAVLLMNARPVWQPDRGSLVIDFAPENSFAYKAVQKPEVIEAVGLAIARSCGEKIPFSYTQGSAGPAEAKVAAAAASSQSGARPAAGAEARPQAASGFGAADRRRETSFDPYAASSPAYDDQVPLDAYAEYEYEPVPYDDVIPVAEDPAGARSAVPEPSGGCPSSSREGVGAASQRSVAGAPEKAEAGVSDAAAPSGEPTDETFAASVVADGEPAVPVDGMTGASPFEPSPQEPDLASILAAGFGEGVRLEEVQ